MPCHTGCGVKAACDWLGGTWRYWRYTPPRERHRTARLPIRVEKRIMYLPPPIGTQQGADGKYTRTKAMLTILKRALVPRAVP
jgi:hypothetical protein